MKVAVQAGLTLCVAAMVAVGWHWSGRSNDAHASRKQPRGSVSATLVLTEKVRFVEDVVEVRAIGTAKAVRSATIHPSSAGDVVDVLFRAGQRVASGDVLIKLEDEHERLAVRLAEVTVKEAARQVKRLERLASTGAASVADLLTARSSLESSQVNLARAKAELGDRTVHAPFAGVIGLTAVEKGDRVDEDTPVATLDDRSAIAVQFDVPEVYAGRLQLGDKVSVNPSSVRSMVLTGTISALDSRIDQTTRSMTVEAEISNAEDRLRPGMSFEVRKRFVGERYPIIEEVALLWSREGAYVWKVNEGRAEKVFVKVVRRDEGRILVDGPLRVDDRIVVEGVQGWRPGQTLNDEPLGTRRE